MANFKLKPPLLEVSNGLFSALTYCLLSTEPSNSVLIIIFNVISLWGWRWGRRNGLYIWDIVYLVR